MTGRLLRSRCSALPGLGRTTFPVFAPLPKLSLWKPGIVSPLFDTQRQKIYDSSLEKEPALIKRKPGTILGEKFWCIQFLSYISLLGAYRKRKSLPTKLDQKARDG